MSLEKSIIKREKAKKSLLLWKIVLDIWQMAW
nr:MAG TPA: hypothetical protein [Caudoviricetes sp.]